MCRELERCTEQDKSFGTSQKGILYRRFIAVLNEVYIFIYVFLKKKFSFPEILFGDIHMSLSMNLCNLKKFG